MTNKLLTGEVTSIAGNIRFLNRRIKEAAERAGRDPAEIKIIAVSKNRQLSEIREVVEAGIKDIGENRVQELLPKAACLGEGVNWHFVGHLQRNKVKKLVPIASLIHSVDSIQLAAEISRRAVAVGKRQHILLEVNVANEPAKYGFQVNEVEYVVEKMAGLPGILIKGLMAMAPLTEDEQTIRNVFACLRKLFVKLKEKKRAHLDFEYLSMGMTNDFEIAIEEGSNMVRVGRAIFEGLKE
jgi:hypothetical protein